MVSSGMDGTGRLGGVNSTPPHLIGALPAWQPFEGFHSSGQAVWPLPQALRSVSAHEKRKGLVAGSWGRGSTA